MRDDQYLMVQLFSKGFNSRLILYNEIDEGRGGGDRIRKYSNFRYLIFKLFFSVNYFETGLYALN